MLCRKLLYPVVLKNCFSTCIISNGPAWLLGSLTCRIRLKELIKVIPPHCHYTKLNFDMFDSIEDMHGMKILNTDAFKRTFSVLSVDVEETKLTALQKAVKKYLLKLNRLKHIRETDKENIKKLLFDPNLIKTAEDFDENTQKLFEEMGISKDRFTHTLVDICYDNWDLKQALRAVLPKGEPPITSYSIIGHIIHVNLKEHLLDYKGIIGRIIFDKIKNVRTVVNKTNRIENVYRNFELELLCGEPDYVAVVKENGCQFKFDFSKVYWNPRLGTEHARVVDSLKKGDVVFDIFCGVGPFSVPAAKKKCLVYANDLNPESVKWLGENVKLNKVSNEQIHIFNKDGSDFICTDVKMNLLKLWNDKDFSNDIIFVMNLPVFGPEFLKQFKGVLNSEANEINKEFAKLHLPTVHCYFFSPPDTADNIRLSLEQRIETDLSQMEHSIHFVRNVAVTKEMYKLMIKLPLEFMIDGGDGGGDKSNNDTRDDATFDEPKSKRMCISKYESVTSNVFENLSEMKKKREK